MARAEIQAGGTLEDWSAHTDDDHKHHHLTQRDEDAVRGQSRVHEAASREGALSATRYALLTIYQARAHQKHSAPSDPPDALVEKIYQTYDLHKLRSWLTPFATLNLDQLERLL